MPRFNFLFLVFPIIFCLCAGTMADDTLRIVDDSHVETEFAHAVTRIVTLSPHATELVYAVGAGSRLVAVSEFSDFPQEALNLPTVSNGSGIDYEAIVAFQPDVVVAWLSGNGMAGIANNTSLCLAVPLGTLWHGAARDRQPQVDHQYCKTGGRPVPLRCRCDAFCSRSPSVRRGRNRSQGVWRAPP